MKPGHINQSLKAVYIHEYPTSHARYVRNNSSILCFLANIIYNPGIRAAHKATISGDQFARFTDKSNHFPCQPAQESILVHP